MDVHLITDVIYLEINIFKGVRLERRHPLMPNVGIVFCIREEIVKDLLISNSINKPKRRGILDKRSCGNARLNDKESSARRSGTTVKDVNIRASSRLRCLDNIAILQLNRNNSLVTEERGSSRSRIFPGLIGISPL